MSRLKVMFVIKYQVIRVHSELSRISNYVPFQKYRQKLKSWIGESKSKLQLVLNFISRWRHCTKC